MYEQSISPKDALLASQDKDRGITAVQVKAIVLLWYAMLQLTSLHYYVPQLITTVNFSSDSNFIVLTNVKFSLSYHEQLIPS